MTQSNEPTIEIMNEAICKFIGGYRLHNGHINVYKGPDEIEWETGTYLKYHKDWNWLMPCWNNLRAELFQCMPASGFNDGFDKYGDAWKTACFNAEIQNAHKVVYSAIKWLNQQKQKDGEG